MPDPITIAALSLQAAQGVGKAIFGATQRRNSKRQLDALRKEQEKNQYIPSAIIKRALEPIDQSLIEAQQMGDERRTAQGIGAASTAGSRGLTAVLPSLLESERISELNRNATYAQAKIDGQRELGAAQEALRREKGNLINQGVLAQTAELGAGQQNIFGGLSDIGMAGLYGAKYLKSDGLDVEDPSKDLMEEDIKAGSTKMDKDYPSLRDPRIMSDPRLTEEDPLPTDPDGFFDINDYTWNPFSKKFEKKKK
jgi:hypothetical protein